MKIQPVNVFTFLFKIETGKDYKASQVKMETNLPSQFLQQLSQIFHIIVL